MAYTKAQWDALQRRLPVADRVSYADYLASEGATATPAAAPTATPAASVIPDSYYVRDPKTGLSQAQIDARAALAQAATDAASLGIEGKVVTPTGSAGQFIPKPTVPPADDKYTYDYVWVGGSTGGSIGSWKLIKTPKTTTTTTTTTTTPTTITTTATTVNANAGNSELLSIIASLQNTISNLTSTTKTDTAAEKAAKDLAERQSAFDLLYSEMDALGLAALVEPLRGLIQKGVSPSEFAVELRQSEAYKARFIANDARLKKGLRVLSPREYLAVEDAYRQTLRTYGLRQFDNDEYVRQFIENDISAAELSDRVAMAVQRVQNADPAISRTLRDYYGIGQNDLVAYVLDPNQQLQKIQRQIAAAEIGTAARVQGIEAGVGVSEQLAAQGITQAQAQKGYATIADILPTAEKLSQIYGTTLEGYDIAQAEQEVFNQLASAQRRRERLTQREIAAFSGQSGLGRTSLTGEARGQF